MSTTIPDTDDARMEAMDAFMDELRAMLSPRRGEPLGHAVSDFTDLIADVAAVLYENDHSTQDTGAVIAFVDEGLAALHAIRAKAVTEHRRRGDAAMERSAKLLGLEGER